MCVCVFQHWPKASKLTLCEPLVAKQLQRALADFGAILLLLGLELLALLFIQQCQGAKRLLSLLLSLLLSGLFSGPK